MRLSCLLALVFILNTACSREPSTFEQFLHGQPGNEFDILIAHGQVVDGTGRKAYPADVLIKNDTIAFVGKVDTALVKVAQTIEAAGKVVTPGFIDTHAHGNPLETPDFQNFLSMGVTTIALGKDGSSPENMTPWMQQTADTIPGVNIAMFVGHGTLRMLSGIEYNPRPTPEQLGDMGKLLRGQLDAGCFGMTTGLEYVPGIYAPDYELEYLAKIVGEKGKLITSHIRNEDDDAVDAAIRELLLQGKYCPVHISHLKVVYGKGRERGEEILKLLADARRQGIRVTSDVYPYTASYTGISILFPEWALPPNDYKQVVATRRRELTKFLHHKVIQQRNGPEATLLGTPPYSGKTLAQVAQEKNKPFEAVLIDDIRPGTASAAYFVMNDSLQSRLITDSLVMICSDGSPTIRHPRGYGAFAKIIEEFVVRDSLLTLEEAIRKMTSLPANTMGMTGRGVLKAGFQADLLVFDPTQVHARATYEDPFQLAQGFDDVLVNGKVSVEQGDFSKERYGKLLKKF